MKAPAFLAAGCIAAFCMTVAPASAKDGGKWAECLWRDAPASSQNWIGLGKPGKKMESAASARSAHLAFRLKTACASVVAPGSKIDDVSFDRNAIWEALAKTPIAMRPSNGESERETNAFMCKTYFLVEDLAEDAKSVPDEVLKRAPMQIDAYEALTPTDAPAMLTKAKQSDGKPISLFRKCQRIGTDGNLVDA